MPRFQKSLYQIKNKNKYIGKTTPICRSSWERSVCIFLDNHSSVLQWASESVAIPYRDILTGKQKRYFPDFFVIYMDANGVKHGELLEIKPSTQTGQKKTKSLINNAQILKNTCKWEAALAYCAKNGLTFRVITELELFGKK